MIIFDVPWVAPAAWAASANRANGYLPNPMAPVAIPAVIAGAPAGAPALPANGASDIVCSMTLFA